MSEVMQEMTANTGWHVSSFSGDQGNCVEVLFDGGQALCRDTKARELGHLTASPEAWGALLAEAGR